MKSLIIYGDDIVQTRKKAQKHFLVTNQSLLIDAFQFERATTSVLNRCTSHISVIVVMDCPENFDFDPYLNLIADGFDVKTKGTPPIRIKPRFAFHSHSRIKEKSWLGASMQARFDFEYYDLPFPATITIPIDPSVTPEQIQAICQRFNCTCKKREGVYYSISTESPENLFWLGINFHEYIQQEQSCAGCGCTDDYGCFEIHTGQTCHWVEQDLCSACSPKPCQHEGCNVDELNTIRCHVTDPESLVEQVEWLCAEHADGIYCRCGEFIAGTPQEGSGMCETCYYEMVESETSLFEEEDNW